MKIEYTAADTRTGMTLGELIAFIQACEKQDMDHGTHIRGTVRINGALKTLAAE